MPPRLVGLGRPRPGQVLVDHAEGHDGGYGRFLVSSGPYMIEGSEKLDFSGPPAEQAPVAGLAPGQHVYLVRNPSWDPSTDQLRLALPERIELSVTATTDDAAADIYSGRAHLLLSCCSNPELSPEIIDAVRAEPGLGRVFISDKDWHFGITMNLAQAPFDDIHVRRAVSYAMNKARIIDLLGGPLRLRAASHLVPDAIEDNLLVDYRPYGSAGDAGDLDAAMAEMSQSGYDTDRDGICDAAACRGVRAIVDEGDPHPMVAGSIRDDLAAIGIELALDVGPTDDFFAALDDPSDHVAMFIPLGWAKDYLSPANFFVPQFHSQGDLAAQGRAGSLVGATRAQLSEWGYGDVEVPNVDAHIEACLPLTGSAQFECWASLDQYMMENVVPLVPYGSGVSVVLASSDVTGFVWDQLAGAPAFDQIVLAP